MPSFNCKKISRGKGQCAEKLVITMEGDNQGNAPVGKWISTGWLGINEGTGAFQPEATICTKFQGGENV